MNAKETGYSYRYVILPIVLIAMLAVLSVPAMAGTNCICDIETNTYPCNHGTSGVINGMVHVDAGVGELGIDHVHIDFADIPEGTVKWARVYWHIWMPGDWTDATFCNVNGCWNNNQTICDPSDESCTCEQDETDGFYGGGCGTTWVYWNVTDMVATGANKTNNISIDNRAPGADGRTMWVYLVVVVESDNYQGIYYWVNQGYEDIDIGQTTTTWFNGDAVKANSSLWHFALCSDVTTGGIWFNGHHVRSDIPDMAKEEIPGDWIELDGDQNMVWDNGDDDWFHPVMAILEIPLESAPDTEPPYTTGHDPAKDATDVPPDTNIVVHVKDDGTGVNQSTIVMKVEGTEVAPTITGDKYDYTLTYDPPTDFDYGQVVDVTVDAKDLNATPNVMPTDSYSFTIKELEPSTSFFISGWVNNSAGEPVNNPVVNITNTNTSEVFTAETIATSNYYQVLTSSENVSAGDVLHFYARDNDGNEEEFDHTVTEAEMNAGGFEQNITILFPYIDLVIPNIDAYHNATGYPPYFNLSNEIDVTVENAGTKAANSSHVSLYIDGEFFDKQSVPALDAGSNATVQFTWTPTGYDCEDGGTPITYTLKAIADCDGEIEELYEGNNETTVQETAYWAGYSADEVLSTAFHGTIHGALNFTTGDGVYTGLYSPGESTDIHYGITLPAGASVELARLNVYYTWSKTDSTGVYPSMEVSITNTSGGTYTLSSVAEYNDRPCDSPAISYDYPFGNYVYDITDYITVSGTYTVTVKNNGPTGHSFAIDPPGLVILYNDTTKPEYEYWILEGADILEGGRRGGGGNLALEECINLATFEGAIDLSKMESATLGLATPWGGDGANPSYLYFNGNELGKDVYHGYSSQYSETLNGISMEIGSTNAQMGVNLTDVANYLAASNNVVGQGDDGDSMMVANAFLFVERAEAKQDDMANADIPVSGTVSGSYVDTQVSDNVYESIEEEAITTGKPSGRISYLEHKWTVDVTGGSSVTFFLEAYHTANTEGDDFVFAYSTDDSTYTDMVTVTKTADDDTYRTYELPSTLSGTVYIRVKDTDRTGGNNARDTIYIDHIFIRSVLGPPDTTAPAAVTDLAAKGPTSSSITLTWTAPGDDGNTGTATSYDIRYSTSTITDANWDSATQCTGEPAPQLAGSSETFSVTGLGANTTYYFALKTSDEVPNESPLSNVANNTTTEAAPNTMHIASIDMSLSQRTAGRNTFTHATAVVTIVDANGTPVGGATVEGHWSDATSDTDSGLTDASGQVSLDSDEVKNAASGTTFTFTVDGVSLTGRTYDPASNVETSDSISV